MWLKSMEGRGEHVLPLRGADQRMPRVLLHATSLRLVMSCEESKMKMKGNAWNRKKNTSIRCACSLRKSGAGRCFTTANPTPGQERNRCKTFYIQKRKVQLPCVVSCVAIPHALLPALSLFR